MNPCPFAITTTAMTWDELAALLVELSEGRVHLLRGDPTLDAVNLPIVPVAYFVSMRADDALVVGTYEGPEYRLQSGERIPLAEVTEADVRRRVEAAYTERARRAFRAVLAPVAGRGSLPHHPRHPRRLGPLADDDDEPSGEFTAG